MKNVRSPWIYRICIGVDLPSGEAVRSMHDTMRHGQVPLVKPLFESPALVSFRCTDPDGHTIEIDWQAPRISG